MFSINFSSMDDQAFKAAVFTYGSCIFAFVTIIIVMRSFSERTLIEARVKKLGRRREELQSELRSGKKRKNTKSTGEGVKTLAQRLNLVQTNQIRKYQELLVSAGINDKNQVFRIALQKVVFALIAGAFLYFFLVRKVEFWPFAWQHVCMMVVAYFAFKVPDIILLNKRNKRWHCVKKALPDGLDLLMVCAEAGLTINSSFERVARELELAYPELSEEFTLTAIEMSFLPEKKKALENLQKRINIPEIRGISSVLVQTEKYGTPVAQALRSLSSEFRQQRMLAAEQKAARLPALMTVPMILFILPTLFIIVITPAILMVGKTM